MATSSILPILKLQNYLSAPLKKKLIILLFLMVVSSLIEIISLGTAIPFLSIISSGAIPTNNELRAIFPLIKQLSYTQSVLLLSSCLFLSVLCSGLSKLYTSFYSSRLTASIGHEISSLVYENWLYEPLEVHSQSNSSFILDGITSQVDQTIYAVNAFLQLCTSLVLSSFLLTSLLLLNVKATLTALALFASCYYIIALAIQQRLKNNGLRIQSYRKQVIKNVQEGLGSIRDVLMDSSQGLYINIYKASDLPMRRTIATNQIISTFPRNLIETLAITIVIFFSLLSILGIGTTKESGLLFIGIFVIAAQKILPAMQQIFSSWSTIKICKTDINNTLQNVQRRKSSCAVIYSKLSFTDTIAFCNVSYRHPGQIEFALRDLNISILKGERIGVSGKTGSGKSTFLDLFMGLIPATEGTVSVDGRSISSLDSPRRSLEWRSSIAHVPQSIFLRDSSIAENICFNVTGHQHSIDEIIEAAEVAQLGEFLSGLENGINTVVGERGVRLSGGQIQRIGIARALFKKAKVLVLDEATSALDQATEFAILQNIANTFKDITIIFVTHKPNTLTFCDRILKIADSHATWV